MLLQNWLAHLHCPAFQTGMTFADTAMTGQYNAEDMAAVAVAGSVFAPVALLGVGCLLALPPLTAQMVGGGKHKKTAHLLRQGIWLTLAICIPIMIFFQIISHQLELFGLSPGWPICQEDICGRCYGVCPHSCSSLINAVFLKDFPVPGQR